MTDDFRPTPVPQRPTVTYNWGARGNPGNRSSSNFGGPIHHNTSGGFSQPTGPRPDAPSFTSRDDLGNLGKTNVGEGLKAPTPQTTLPADLTPPERVPGFFEGMMGGLVEAFTGVLGESGVRDVLTRSAEVAGEVLDIPGEALGHVPINQLFGLENLESAFKMLPMTQDKQRVINAMTLIPGEKEWYMSQYLRTHSGDYAAAKGLPQVLAHIIRPDATIQERFFMALGLPAQAVARLRAGGGMGIFGNRAMDILNNPDLDDPVLVEIKNRYQRGEFGQVGSQKALDRFVDEIVTSGYGWHDDPFIGMVAEMLTDPIIVAGMGTGLAMGAVRTGSLARRAANLSTLARSAGKTDDLVQAAVTRADMAVEAARAQGKGGLGDTTYEWSKQFMKEGGDTAKRMRDDATEMLRTQRPGKMGTKDYYVVKMAPAIEGAATISAGLNAPFGFFGKDGIAGLVGRKFAQDSSDAVFSAYDIGLVGSMYDAVGDSAVLNRSVGHAIAYTQKSLMQNNLIQMLRIRMGRGKLDSLPDALSDPEKALSAMAEGDNKMSVQGLEVHVRRTAKDYEPELQGIEGEAARKASYDRQMTQYREDGAKKLARAAGISLDEARAITKNATAKELSFIDYAHWGRTIQDFVAVRDMVQGKMRKGMASTIDAATTDPEILKMLEDLDNYDIVARATLVGERELTMQAAKQLLDDLTKAADDAERMRIIEMNMNKYEYIYQNLYEKTRITSDADLIERFTTLLDEGMKNERFVVVLNADSLVDDLAPLGDMRNRLHANGAPYEIGLAPARDKRWAPIYNGKNELVGYRPWMDIRVTPEDVSQPTTFDVLRNRLMTPIRGENIMQEGRRKFGGYMNQKYGLGRAASTALWDATRKAARDRQITMRGFTPAEFRNIMADVDLPDWDKEQLGPRGLADAVAHAMEGDLAMVGLTTKATGIMKTRTYKYQNYIGVLAEKIYPLVRFNYNPLFQLQELLEPYFFNVLRGIKSGYKFSEEQLGIHQLLDEFNMADKLADGFEAREFMMSGSIHANNMGSALAKVDFDGTVQTKKRINYYNATKRIFGDELHRVMEKEMPGQWTRIENMMNELDIAERGSKGGALSRGDVAERWFLGKGGANPDNSWNSINHYDGAVPDQYGRIRGIDSSYLAKHFGYSDGAALRAAAMDPLDPFTEGVLKENLVREGFTPEYAERAWNVATGPTVDEVLDSIEGDFADKGFVDFHRDLARALLDTQAVLKGISTDELVATKFVGSAKWVDHNARLPLRAYTQLARRMGIEWELPPLGADDPRMEKFADRVQALYPSSPPDRKVLVGHANAHKAEYNGTAPKVLNTQAQKTMTVGGLKVGPNKSATQFVNWMDSSKYAVDDVADVAAWYEELSGMFGGLAFGMPDEMIESLMPLLPDHARVSLDDARAEVGARLFMSWMSTQVQASPQAGLQAALTLMDEVAGGRRSIVHQKAKGGEWTPHRFGDQSQKYYAMLRDFDDTLTPLGFGVKLYDFTDSSRANINRTFAGFMDEPMMHTLKSQGRDVPMQPGAMDIWAMRERGFIDGPMLTFLARRVARQSGWEGKAGEARALVKVQKQTGFFLRKKVQKGDKKVPEPMDTYRARMRQFEAEQGLEPGSLRAEWDGTPSPVEYEKALKQYNDLTDDLNAMDDGNGWEGRGYKNKPWTVREIQSIAWVQMRNEFEVTDFNIQHYNSAQLQYTFQPSPHMPWRETLPIHRATAAARDHIADEMALDLSERMSKLSGVTVTRIVPGTSGSAPMGIMDNTFFEVTGSPEQLRDAARVMAFLTHSDIVHGVKPSEKTATTRGSVWAIDFVTPAGTKHSPKVLDKLGRWLDQREDFQWNGYGTGSMNDGRMAVRSVFDPDEKKRMPGAIEMPVSVGLKTKTKSGRQVLGFEDRVPIGDETARMLADGSWATDAGLKKAIPVETQRTVYDNYTQTNDWGDDASRAHARVNAGENADKVWAEEMGRTLLEDMTRDGRADTANSLVTHDMAGFTTVGDSALRKYDSNAWAVGRGTDSVIGPYRHGPTSPELGAGAIYSDTDGVLQQRGTNSRGQPVWNAATKWASDADRAQRIVSGKLRNRRGELVFREGRADVTSVAHELLHIFSDDLEPSAVKSIHVAFFKSDAGKQFLANGGERPKGRHAHNRVIPEAEEWMAYQFEEWLGSGVAPNSTMNGVFQQYSDMYQKHRTFAGQNVDPALADLFDQRTPEMHRGPATLWDPDEYRLMETARQALMKAEEEAFRVHYYKRGRSWLERSINHPYLGLYPASYMWGKVLPELMRFLVRKPFGIDAPFAGLQMANHVFEAIQLEMNTDDGAMADLIEEYPEAIRFLQLLIPGTPWDIPVNVPAWTRRIAKDAWSGRSPDFGQALTDTITYSFGPGRAPADLQDAVADAVGLVQSVGQMATGEYQSPAQREASEASDEQMRALGILPPEEDPTPRLIPGRGLPPTNNPLQ